MTVVTKASRLGPFVVFQDQDGLRHAVRHSGILAISEVDDGICATIIQMTGQRTATVRTAFEEVLRWFW